MVLPYSVSGPHGSAMLVGFGDVAPAALGVLLVLGLVADLVASAGIPVTTTAAGASNHSGNRYVFDSTRRRSYGSQERSLRNPTEVQDDVIRLAAEDAVPSQVESSRDCRFHECSVPEGRSSADQALGTRMRPLHRPPITTEITGRKRKNKKGDDDDDYYDDDDDDEEDDKGAKGPAKTFKIKKHKLKKWLLPLLVGYKLKFMTLVPLLFATLALLVASAGFAGFFFAMFTAALTLPKGGGHH